MAMEIKMNSNIQNTAFEFRIAYKRDEDGNILKNADGEVLFETITLYTFPFISAKLKFELDKLFVPMVNDTVLAKLNTDTIGGVLSLQGQDIGQAFAKMPKAQKERIVELQKTQLLTELSQSPAERLQQDYNTMVEFCMICIDKQEMLRQDAGRSKLDKVMDLNLWELQDAELLRSIINQYSPSVSETT